jgi:hypothetical protein
LRAAHSGGSGRATISLGRSGMHLPLICFESRLTLSSH